MFGVDQIKNANRRGADAKKIESIPRHDLVKRRDNERTVPYYSVVREQVKSDERMKKLSPIERGMFLLLCNEAWGNGGMFQNFDQGIAKDMNITCDEWLALKQRFTSLGLLITADESTYLIQPELREQYLQFLQAHPGATRKNQGAHSFDDPPFEDDPLF